MHTIVQYKDYLRNICGKMLGKLLQSLKSQKSSKINPNLQAKSQSQSQQQSQLQQPHQQQSPLSITISCYKIPQSILTDAHQAIVPTKIPKIRYYVLPDLPSIFAQVLGCPISVFHHLPHGQRKVKEIDLRKYDMPHYLEFLRPLLEREIPGYNHVLVNDYPAGIGIMPHSDGPAYRPKVLVLSLNSYCIINFQQSYNNTQEKASYSSRIMLQPNSIHIFEQQAYSSYLHGIQNYAIDSILLYYDSVEQKIVRVNVDNYGLLAVRGKIEQAIRKGKEEVEVESNGEGEIRVIRVQGNQKFSHKVEFRRKERVSITIRCKYQ